MIHHRLDVANVLRRPSRPSATRMGVSRGTLTVAVVHSSIFQLLLVETPDCCLVRKPSSREFGVEVGENSLEEVSASFSLSVLE